MLCEVEGKVVLPCCGGVQCTCGGAMRGAMLCGEWWRWGEGRCWEQGQGSVTRPCNSSSGLSSRCATPPTFPLSALYPPAPACSPSAPRPQQRGAEDEVKEEGERWKVKR
eukprot:3933794-Rhodomonas_salina.3